MAATEEKKTPSLRDIGYCVNSCPCGSTDATQPSLGTVWYIVIDKLYEVCQLIDLIHDQDCKVVSLALIDTTSGKRGKPDTIAVHTTYPFDLWMDPPPERELTLERSMATVHRRLPRVDISATVVENILRTSA